MKKNNILKWCFAVCIALQALPLLAWPGMPLPRLHVDGRYLKDVHGNIVNLHGFAQTYSPYFNEVGKYWNNYDVQGCLNYNQGLIDKIMEAGWKMNYLRLHMDPYWSNTPGCTPEYHEAHNCFNVNSFKRYLDQVFVPMAEYAVSKGLYVVMRPPGVSPHTIQLGDSYQNYLIRVWTIVAQHPKLQNHPNIMFELANEPISMSSEEGNDDPIHKQFTQYFQDMVDAMRAEGCNNIIWVPGPGYQSDYRGFATYPIVGKNIGYAVHVYPGWFGSDAQKDPVENVGSVLPGNMAIIGGDTIKGGGYQSFQEGWDRQVKPVADFAPIMITEMDWAPLKYSASWGKSVTGTAGGRGFGANLKKICDDSGNVSWLIFTEPHHLAKFVPEAPAEGEPYTLLTDPEACPWAAYFWYEEYAKVETPRPDYTKLSISDNGDGTYTNPVIHGEFPDPDVIRVGDVYYMVSTTMFYFPGATLLKSYDLVNWEYCSNPLQMIEASDDYNLLNGKNRYARGQWATSLKYNNGTFYMLFTTLDEGGYLLTATDPEGSWEIQKLSQGYYDPGLFFDDDGKIYVACGINTITMCQLDKEFNRVRAEQIFVGGEQDGLEGCHVYKINDYYYIYATYGGLAPLQTVLRSKSIWGPYEEKVVLRNDDNIHQGALIETQSGEWWTMLFYDKMPYGRMPNLQPITWEDGWPMIGQKVDGEYKSVKTHKKPNVGATYPRLALATNDNFRDYKLGLQWEWNHNPDHSKWSLFERPGFLRLKAATVTESILEARNTLTQRLFGYQSEAVPSYGTAKFHIANMADGDVAGLTLFTKPNTLIGVKKEGNSTRVFVEKESATTLGMSLAETDSVVYFRAVAQFKFNAANRVRFYYSVDNITYLPVGSEFTLPYSYDLFVAPRFGLFTYATKELGGYVDVDWFTTEEEFTEENFYDENFQAFSEAALTPVSLNLDIEQIDIVMGSSKTLRIIATFEDGHTEDVTTQLEVINTNPAVVSYQNGQLVGTMEGESTLTLTYTGPLGQQISSSLHVSSSVFPLVEGLINPSIYGTGSFNASRNELRISQYGFGGWNYDHGINLSDYKYIVVELAERQSIGASFRIFDENSYWSDPFFYEVGSKTTFAVDLHNMRKGDGTKGLCDPKHIYIVGFWSYGGVLKLKNIFLSNDGETPVDVEDLLHSSAEPISTLYYNAMGIQQNGLVKGVNIVRVKYRDGKELVTKVMVR